MSTKFEQLLDLLVNEEMDKANNLFHEIVVEKSREIYENLIAEEAEDDEEMDESKEEDEEMDESKEEDDEEMDEGREEDDEEMDESREEELEDSYMMDADDEMDDGGMGGDATDDMLGDIESDSDEMGDEGGAEDEAIMDIKNAIAELEAAFADLEAAQGGGGEMDMDSEFDDEDDEEGDEMMGLREYRETVGNDWEKSGSQKTAGPVGSGKGELAGQTSVNDAHGPVSSGKGKPTTGATAKNILGDTKTGEGTNVGTKPTGKAGGLVGNVKGEFTKGVEKNIAGSATAKMKDGAALSKQGAGYPGNNKTAGPVGSGKGELAGQTSGADSAKSPINGAPNRNA